MARGKKKELTKEEQLANERAREIALIEDRVQYINEPTYSFEIGDKVRYGALKESVVEDILYDGKVYVLKCIAIETNYGNPFEKECYRVAPWHSIRPFELGVSDFTTKEDFDIRFSNSTIESLLHKYYMFGVNMDPIYQRELVWDDTDRESLLESVFMNCDIGKFAFVHLDDKEWGETGFGYEILDGKQRLQTLLDFYENRFPYKGCYFNDLSAKDRRTFKGHNISIGELRDVDESTRIKCFLKLNRGGRVISQEHLKKVESLVKES